MDSGNSGGSGMDARHNVMASTAAAQSVLNILERVAQGATEVPDRLLESHKRVMTNRWLGKFGLVSSGPIRLDAVDWPKSAHEFVFSVAFIHMPMQSTCTQLSDHVARLLDGRSGELRTRLEMERDAMLDRMRQESNRMRSLPPASSPAKPADETVTFEQALEGMPSQRVPSTAKSTLYVWIREHGNLLGCQEGLQPRHQKLRVEGLRRLHGST